MKVIGCLFVHPVLERQADSHFYEMPMGIFAMADLLEKNGFETSMLNIGVEKN